MIFYRRTIWIEVCIRKNEKRRKMSTCYRLLISLWRNRTFYNKWRITNPLLHTYIYRKKKHYSDSRLFCSSPVLPSMWKQLWKSLIIVDPLSLSTQALFPLHTPLPLSLKLKGKRRAKWWEEQSRGKSRYAKSIGFRGKGKGERRDRMMGTRERKVEG